jgi:hypothetical protein
MYMMKLLIVLIGLAITLSACGKNEKEVNQQAQIQMQADKARLELQQKADALARNPPPELIEAAKAQAALEAAKAGKGE